MIHCGIVQSGRKSNGAKGQIRSTVQAQNALRAIQGSGIYKIRSAFAGLLRRLEQKAELSTKAVTILGEDFRGTQEPSAIVICESCPHEWFA